MKIAEKVAIVTGGCQGIGKGIIYALLRRGAKVANLDINDAKGEALKEILDHEFGEGRTVYRHCDVADKNQLKDVVESVKSRFNGIDIIVNNAAIIAVDDWDKMLDINLRAVINATKFGIEMMDKNSGNNGGVIINMASLAGIFPMELDPIYSTTKAGVVTFTRCFKAAARSQGVRVNCICPSFVAETSMVNRGYEIFQEKMDALVKYSGTVPIDMVASAVVQTIEDDTLAGNAIPVTQKSGIQKHSFSKANL